MVREPAGGAGIVEPSLVGEVPVHREPLHPRPFGDGADHGVARPDLLVQRDHRVEDPHPGLVGPIGPSALHIGPSGAFGHLETRMFTQIWAPDQSWESGFSLVNRNVYSIEPLSFLDALDGLRHDPPQDGRILPDPGNEQSTLESSDDLHCAGSGLCRPESHPEPFRDQIEERCYLRTNLLREAPALRGEQSAEAHPVFNFIGTDEQGPQMPHRRTWAKSTRIAQVEGRSIHVPTGQRFDQTLFRREVVVNAGAGDPHLLGQVAKAEAVVSSPPRSALRRIEDGFLHLTSPSALSSSGWPGPRRWAPRRLDSAR